MVKTNTNNEENTMTPYQECTQKLDQCLQTIHETNCTLYRQNLEIMDDDDLAYEFSSRIGNECGDFDWLMAHSGREAVIERLADNYEVTSFERLLA